MTPNGNAPDEQLLRELDRRREDERDEREERRGLENRASALLAAGAAVIGLVATSVKDLGVTGSQRDALLGGVGLASVVMVISFGFVVKSLTGRPVRPERIDASPRSELDAVKQRVDKIRANNIEMLGQLRTGTLVFGVSVALFTGIVFWAAIAAKTTAARQPIVVRVVHGPRGPRGERGVRGPRGPRG